MALFRDNVPLEENLFVYDSPFDNPFANKGLNMERASIEQKGRMFGPPEPPVKLNVAQKGLAQEILLETTVTDELKQEEASSSESASSSTPSEPSGGSFMDTLAQTAMRDGVNKIVSALSGASITAKLQATRLGRHFGRVPALQTGIATGISLLATTAVYHMINNNAISQIVGGVTGGFLSPGKPLLERIRDQPDLVDGLLTELRAVGRMNLPSAKAGKDLLSLVATIPSNLKELNYIQKASLFDQALKQVTAFDLFLHADDADEDPILTSVIMRIREQMLQVDWGLEVAPSLKELHGNVLSDTRLFERVVQTPECLAALEQTVVNPATGARVPIAEVALGLHAGLVVDVVDKKRNHLLFRAGDPRVQQFKSLVQMGCVTAKMEAARAGRDVITLTDFKAGKAKVDAIPHILNLPDIGRTLTELMVATMNRDELVQNADPDVAEVLLYMEKQIISDGLVRYLQREETERAYEANRLELARSQGFEWVVDEIETCVNQTAAAEFAAMAGSGGGGPPGRGSRLNRKLRDVSLPYNSTRPSLTKLATTGGLLALASFQNLLTFLFGGQAEPAQEFVNNSVALTTGSLEVVGNANTLLQIVYPTWSEFLTGPRALTLAATGFICLRLAMFMYKHRNSPRSFWDLLVEEITSTFTWLTSRFTVDNVLAFRSVFATLALMCIGLYSTDLAATIAVIVTLGLIEVARNFKGDVKFMSGNKVNMVGIQAAAPGGVNQFDVNNVTDSNNNTTDARTQIANAVPPQLQNQAPRAIESPRSEVSPSPRLIAAVPVNGTEVELQVREDAGSWWTRFAHGMGSASTPEPSAPSRATLEEIKHADKLAFLLATLSIQSI